MLPVRSTMRLSQGTMLLPIAGSAQALRTGGPFADATA
jgi:hypothetical protein